MILDDSISASGHGILGVFLLGRGTGGLSFFNMAFANVATPFVWDT